jgi:putative transposase
MPWKEYSVMDERMKFVARLLEGDSMTELCREFGISRKTGYKILDRYQNSGIEGLTDRSRRPIRYANQLPMQIEQTILNIKRDKPTWGARKIRERIYRKYPNIKIPAASTIHAVLDRHGMVQSTKRARFKSKGTFLSNPLEPNTLWCADYKGEFMMGNKEYCYPLTITDYASRYLIACDALQTTKEQFAFTVFENAFKEFGLPNAIRTDNGVPFASPMAIFNLSRLSVWWLRLGIKIELIKPGNPQQNGRHERMHLTLKKQTTKPAAQNILQQQAKFDDFIEEFNNERPHEGLDMKYPGEIYKPSQKLYRGLPPVEYPMHDRTIVITNCGRICMGKAKVHFSQVFAGQQVGVKEIEDNIWLLSFMDYDLGYFDLESKKVEPLDDPFGSGLLPMSPE